MASNVQIVSVAAVAVIVITMVQNTSVFAFDLRSPFQGKLRHSVLAVIPTSKRRVPQNVDVAGVPIHPGALRLLSPSDTDNYVESRIVQGPDPETKPDYSNIHGPMGKSIDDIFLKMFRSSLAYHVGVDSERAKDDYQGLMELTTALNARYQDRTQVQTIAQNTLRSLFPSWLPGQFAILFSKPFPKVS